MCNYDYTPYKGCAEGEQHYFIQWIKCGIAAESGRYCSLEASTRLEQIAQISGNVLACPLHGPVAVQQYILESANPRYHDEDEEKRRPRSTTRRTGVSRGRTPHRDPSRVADEAAHREVKEVRRQRSRRDVAHDSSDSETNSRENRARLARKASRRGESERRDTGSRSSRTNSHRRSTSEDLDRIPPVPPLSMRYGRSETSLPLEAEPEVRRESRRTSNASSSSHLQAAADIPRAPGVIGLPSAPDMHRRASIRRAQSDAMLKDADLPPLPSPRSWVSPTSDSSPDHDPTMPFSSPSRRGRRPTRSIGDRSVDTSMRRIDEDVATDEPPLSPRSLPPQPGPAPTRSPPPEPTGAGALHYPSRRSRSANRPQLNNLQIPKPTDKYQREYHSAPTATPPETEISEGRKRSVDASLGNAPQAARESSSNLPATARASVDSGYLSGHSRNGRNTLQKAPPQHLREQTQQQQQQQKQQSQGQGQSQEQGQGQSTTDTQAAAAQAQARPSTDGRQSPEKKARPAPLNLANATPGHGLPPCALPVSLVSPSCQSDAEASTASNGSKKTHSTLLQRMGLKRKISGLLDRERTAGGVREVGVKG
ncbi:hypothetical protein VTJ49DRAFT_7301 [Mycothermus thermophilus]|uniref:Uncharacterized protein n=1 Tax=Humicola insolens TaxID=85995 RepID=A0ABR3VIP6_HUMIN